MQLKSHSFKYFFLFILLSSLALGLSWRLGNLWKPIRSTLTLEELGIKDGHVKLLSHQGANEYPKSTLPLRTSEYPWTYANGTILPYITWLKNPPIPKQRSTLNIHGARVACWPSTGGIYIKQADALDMDFLGLDRFADRPRHNRASEDEFCTLLKMLGADFYKLPPRLEQRRPGPACETLEQCFEPDSKNEWLVAWPEDWQGMCAIPIDLAKERGSKFIGGGSVDIDGPWRRSGRKGAFMGGWHRARTMNERCKVIWSLFGAWCYCKDECPHLRDLDWGFRDSTCDGDKWNHIDHLIDVGRETKPHFDESVSVGLQTYS